jgi:cell division protein FtsB
MNIENKDIEQIREELKELKKISKALFNELERMKDDIVSIKEYVYE